MRLSLSVSLPATVLAGGLVFIAGSAVMAERVERGAGAASVAEVPAVASEHGAAVAAEHRARARLAPDLPGGDLPGSDLRWPDLPGSDLRGSDLPGPEAIGRLQALSTPERHAFAFTRGIYSGYRGRWGRRGSWAIDYPKADRQFLTVLRRLTNIDAYASENAVALDDPELRRFPFIYMLEVGSMSLTEAEVNGLRGYLLAGGFAFIDDFWGTREWQNFERQMRIVLPEYPIVELPLDHPVFNSLYRIRELVQVPAVDNWRWRRQTHESDGYEPHARAILDHEGRLMVMINWNTDIGDAWEWAEQPDYPLEFSTFAYQIGANAIIYAMSH